MTSDETPADSASSATGRRISNKRKRETPASRLAAKASRTNTPNAYARRTPPPEPTPIEADGDHSPPRKLKRPGASSRIAPANREAAERLQKQREEEEKKAVSARSDAGAASVAAHYNAVPERGRDWRQTDSRIKGLRSLNNWIKSTLIQKFSRPDIPVQDMRVLDMACGKGGDLGKWEKAPQVPMIYVGCDIADVSIDQAKKRYAESSSRGGRFRRGPSMRAEFYVHDTFGQPLNNVPAVQAIGFNPNAGPGSGIIQPGMMTGGFDVVSMMFALHYSFESEKLARGMLANVSGALKKGGRFIGVMPDSDVISSQVKQSLSRMSTGKTPDEKPMSTEKEPHGVDGHGDEGDDWDPEMPSEPNATADDDDWDPEKSSDPQPTADNDDDDGWDPENPSEPKSDSNMNKNSSPDGAPADDGSQSPLRWGNSIYNIRFPRQQALTQKPLPRDGVFRPPFGWKYHYTLEEAVNAPEYVVPWEAFRALAEEYGLELLYRKGFREVLEDESGDPELGQLAERMNVMRHGKPLPTAEEMDAAAFYHAFVFYRT